MSHPDLPEPLCQKRDRLLDRLRGWGSCGVAFSGGLDSAVLAKAAALALGPRAAAFTATSPSTPAGELDAAVALARRIGIRHEVIATDEMSDPAYQANTPQRCYHCKSHVFGQIQAAAGRLGLAVVADGSNADDRLDYRPGHRAANELGVQSPLAECELSKAELRQLAAAWELPVWDKPASPCLASRVAYGEAITPERLAMIDRAESFLRAQGLAVVRVRVHRDDLARIEVQPESLGRFAEEAFRRQVAATLREAGFRYVSLDLEGYRGGSLNEGLGDRHQQQQDG